MVVSQVRTLVRNVHNSCCGSSKRILHSTTRSVPRLNYHLHPLAELHIEENSGLEYLVSAADREYRTHLYDLSTGSTGGNPKQCPSAGYPLLRKLRPSR